MNIFVFLCSVISNTFLGGEGLQLVFYEELIFDIRIAKGINRRLTALSIYKGGLEERWKKAFYKDYSDRKGDNGFKLEESRFILDMKKKW